MGWSSSAGQGGFSGGGSWRPPLFTLGKFPIHVTGLIVLLQIAGMLAVIFVNPALNDLMLFDAPSFLSGHYWSIVTYPFFEYPSLGLAIGLYFFAKFGSEVERSMSRQLFVKLCASLLLIPPAIFLLFNFIPGFIPISKIPQLSNVLHLSIFISFCVIFPTVPTILQGVQMKWFAVVFFALALVQSIPVWPLVLSYVVGAAVVILLMKSLGHGSGFSFGMGSQSGSQYRRSSQSLSKKQKARRAKETKPKLRPKSALSKADDSEVDRILDKINSEGLHSLTEEERELLQRKSGK